MKIAKVGASNCCTNQQRSIKKNSIYLYKVCYKCVKSVLYI